MAERNERASARRKTSETVETTKEAAQQTLDAAKEGAGATAEAAQRGAARLGEQMRDAAESLLHEQKDRMADAVHDLADALRRTAGTFEHEQKATAARYAGQAADQIDRFSATMRDQQMRDLLAKAEGFARRQPVLFIAGAIAAGFVVGRILARPAGDGAAHGYQTGGGTHGQHGYLPQEESLAGYGAGTEAGPL